jgi:hypothetical protein
VSGQNGGQFSPSIFDVIQKLLSATLPAEGKRMISCAFSWYFKRPKRSMSKVFAQYASAT